MPKHRYPSQDPAYRRARGGDKLHRATGYSRWLLDADEPGFGGGNEWMRDAAKGSAELARRVLKLLGAREHG